METIKELKVGLDFGVNYQSVGRLALRSGVIYFQYDAHFIRQSIEISPFRLPLREGVIGLPLRPFGGLAGVFSDSLPDGWGRLLFDRIKRSQGIAPDSLSSLDRLAHVGSSGLGALIYEPDYGTSDLDESFDLDHLAGQVEEVLEGSSGEVLKELLVLNGSSAGARPKALIRVDETCKNISYGSPKLNDGFEDWLVKFPNTQDGQDAGAIEYVYALMAKQAGLETPKVHLFPSQKGPGYFAVKRFDRIKNRKLHMHSASGLLHSDFRMPTLDYEDLINLTGTLTKDIRQVEDMFRLAVFNVLAHNRDDHGKNFSFLMDEQGNWRLAPAYDLTFSSGPNNEQSSLVVGNGGNPGISDLIALGTRAKLSRKLIENTIEQTLDALSLWENLARTYGVQKDQIKLISTKISRGGNR